MSQTSTEWIIRTNYFKAGSKVKCIATSPICSITVGKVYEVESYKEYGDTPDWNSIKDDGGDFKIINHKDIYPSFELFVPKPDFFHVGARVRCIQRGCHNFTVNKVYSVIEYDDHGDTKGWNSIVDDSGIYKLANNKSVSGCFELVSEEDLDVLAKNLVNAYNAVVKAAAAGAKFEHKDNTFAWRDYNASNENWEVRVKPKASPFEPFTVGSSWKVSLAPDDKSVIVGCKKYEIEKLRTDLRALCRFGANNSTSTGTGIVAYREGVRDAQNVISWVDADKLLAALEKVK